MSLEGPGQAPLELTPVTWTWRVKISSWSQLGKRRPSPISLRFVIVPSKCKSVTSIFRVKFGVAVELGGFHSVQQCVNGLEPLPYFPWHHHDTLWWASILFRHVQTVHVKGIFENLLPCRTYVNPCSWVDMLSMSKQPQVATGRYKDMSSSWGKTKEAATGDLSLWKHAMRRHPIFRLVPPLEKCFHETVTWSQQGKHLEGCDLNKSF